MAYAQFNYNEPWTTHDFLGTFRQTRPEDWYFGQFFPNQMRSESEWIDFEKLPIRNRGLAPFVKPLGRGKAAFRDRSQGYRFKPANIVMEDALDPLRPLTFQPGIGESMFDPAKMSPVQRAGLIKIEMMREMQLFIERRWEWLKARAIIDGKVTITYLDGTSVLVDFQRDAALTEVLTAGNYWGQSGVSIVDAIQNDIDQMNNIAFGGMPVRITMGGRVATVVRKDAEMLAHLDTNIRGGTIVLERGLVSGANGGGKVYKFGEMIVGGASGQRIELWVNNETYTNDAGTEVRYLGDNEVVYTSTPEAINGYECFGRIVDPDAGYQALPIFPKEWRTTDGRIKVDNLSAESAPLMVPINPNATKKKTVLAAS
jgi:hypothetical protein